MSERTDDALSAHAAECGDCAGTQPPLAAIAAVLDADVRELDAAQLSASTMARLAPALQARADALFWRRFTRALVAGLVPLPLVIALNAWLLPQLYELAAGWVPAIVAAYLVFGYGVSLLVLIAGSYAAIPLLLARPVPEPEPTPA